MLLEVGVAGGAEEGSEAVSSIAAIAVAREVGHRGEEGRAVLAAQVVSVVVDDPRLKAKQVRNGVDGCRRR
jgi:hypothetical protein